MSVSKISESFLVTEEDFINMQLARRCYYVSPKRKIILRIMGMIAVFSGAAATIFVKVGVWQMFCWILLILTGFYMLSYYDVIDPLMIKKASSRFYQFNKNAINSRTIEFAEDKFSVISEDYKLELPEKYIYCIAESPSTIFIFTDKSEFVFIPRRVLSDEKIQFIRSFTSAEKYKTIQIPKEA